MTARIKVKWLSIQRKTIDPLDMPDGDLELWSIPDFDNGSPSITNRQSIGSSKKVVFPGDVLLSKIVPHIRRAWIVSESNLPQYASTEWLTFHSSKVRPEFLRYALLTDEFNRQMQLNSNGMGSLKRADPEKVGEQLINLPTIRKQKIIADFLDKRLVAIDAVLHQKSEQLKKLSSYRQSLITRAVTKGLDPNVEMKDSGVEWIGSIPREWKTSKISFVSDVTLGKMLCPRQTDSEQTLETYLCAGSISWDGVKDYIKEMWFSSKEKSELLLIAGDVLVVEGGAGFGMTTLYKGEHSPCYFQNSIIRVRGHHNVMTSDFINYWMRFTYTAYLKTVCNEATFSHYTKEKVSETPILVPPLNEQKKIADFCKLVDERVKTICAGIENQISKLNEYRSSLISAAVTGQLAIDEEASA